MWWTTTTRNLCLRIFSMVPISCSVDCIFFLYIYTILSMWFVLFLCTKILWFNGFCHLNSVGYQLLVTIRYSTLCYVYSSPSHYYAPYTLCQQLSHTFDKYLLYSIEQSPIQFAILLVLILLFFFALLFERKAKRTEHNRTHLVNIV